MLGTAIFSPPHSSRGKGPIFRWPTADIWWLFVRGSIGLTLLWIIVYGGANYLATQHNYRVRLHFGFELTLPFWPNWSVVYLSLFPMLWLSPFVLAEEYRMRRLVAAIGGLIAISGVGFVLLPSTPAYDLHNRRADATALFAFADRMNLDFNMLPSLHVGMAVLCALAYGAEKPWWIKVGVWAWATAIAVSTLLLHQHHLADVMAGAACAVIVHRVVRARVVSRRPDSARNGSSP